MAPTYQYHHYFYYKPYLKKININPFIFCNAGYNKIMNKDIYVKDSEGFVTKKSSNELITGETIISKEEFEQISGIDYYKNTFIKKEI